MYEISCRFLSAFYQCNPLMHSLENTNVFDQRDGVYIFDGFRAFLTLIVQNDKEK
ncbi:hypothetical protein WN51_04911 [Melipona quadrifasciata]|uniref:Uncharacterized protein n=1 Tax=Melipona quadrifasciata TaxID=166423 RepID=A0A0N0U3Y9_9HYME|nr:hypothetical protein WN51_04911 [Melipona quadrifasciata]